MNAPTRALAVILSALLLPAAGLAADTAPDGKAATETSAKSEAKAETAPEAESAADDSKPKPAAKCEYLTGSRIRHDPPVDCDSGTSPTRVFTREELENTGEASLGDALRALDPRLR
jgi:hypothetical protein